MLACEPSWDKIEDDGSFTTLELPAEIDSLLLAAVHAAHPILRDLRSRQMIEITRLEDDYTRITELKGAHIQHIAQNSDKVSFSQAWPKFALCSSFLVLTSSAIKSLIPRWLENSLQWTRTGCSVLISFALK